MEKRTIQTTIASGNLPLELGPQVARQACAEQLRASGFPYRQEFTEAEATGDGWTVTGTGRSDEDDG